MPCKYIIVDSNTNNDRQRTEGVGWKVGVARRLGIVWDRVWGWSGCIYGREVVDLG